MPKRVFVSREASQVWNAKARAMIRASDLVICGKHTREVVGVAIELEISRQEGIPGFLLNRYDGQTGAEQTTERVSDKLYTWTWPLLETLAGGAR